MVNIKWSNGYSNFKTTYYKPFKRLDSCNAAWYENVTMGNKDCNALGHDYKYETFGFVSYDTPIMFIWHAIDMTDNHDFYDIHVNLESFNCSSATIHQLVRFMRYVFDDCFTYQDLKSYCLEYGKIYKSLSFRSYISATIYFSDYHNLTTLMNSHDNATWITNYE